MAKNYIQEGKTIDVVLAAAVSSGDPVVVGEMVGIAQVDGAIGDTIAVALEGVYEVPQAAEVIELGSAVYWDADGDPYGGTAGSGAATNTSTDNKLLGYALELTTATTQTVKVKLSR